MNHLPGDFNMNRGLYFSHADRPMGPTEPTNPSVMMIPRYLTSSEIDLQNHYKWSMYQAYCQAAYNSQANMPIPGSLPFRNPSNPVLQHYNMYPQQLYCGSPYNYPSPVAQTPLYVPPNNMTVPPPPAPEVQKPRPQESQAYSQRISVKPDNRKVLTAPKPVKKEKPEVIVLEDSDDILSVEENHKIQLVIPPISTQNTVKESTSVIETDVTAKTNDINTQKQVEEESKPEKQTTIPSHGKKTPGRTVTKTFVVEDGCNDTRIRIKKISKGPKPEVQKPKPKLKERLLRERRVINVQWPILPRYNESPGKIKFGADHQTTIPEFLLNEPGKMSIKQDFEAEKSLKLQQLRARLVWNKSKHQGAYNTLKEKFPQTSFERVIGFIKQNDRPQNELTAYIADHQNEIRKELQVPQQNLRQAIASEDNLLVRIDSKPLDSKS